MGCTHIPIFIFAPFMSNTPSHIMHTQLAGVQRLYGDEELADVVLRVESGEVGEGCADGCGPGGSCAAGGSGEAGAGSCSGCSREFRAHRSVLAASSRVFDRMFRHTDVTVSRSRRRIIAVWHTRRGLVKDGVFARSGTATSRSCEMRWNAGTHTHTHAHTYTRTHKRAHTRTHARSAQESERREVVIGGVRPDVFEALLQYGLALGTLHALTPPRHRTAAACATKQVCPHPTPPHPTHFYNHALARFTNCCLLEVPLIHRPTTTTPNVTCRYAYCSLSEVPPALATELFRAADRYDVEGLRTQCLSVLKQVIRVYVCVIGVVGVWGMGEDTALRACARGACRCSSS